MMIYKWNVINKTLPFSSYDWKAYNARGNLPLYILPILASNLSKHVCSLNIYKTNKFTNIRYARTCLFIIDFYDAEYSKNRL